jgi:sugar lactone lactonase YvrE
VGAGARFNNPVALTYRAGVLYVADFLSHTVRKITISGTTYTVSTLAGLAGVPGAVDGQGTAARLSQPFGIDVDGWGNVFISEAGNQLLRRITPAGKVSTIAGAAELAGGVDGVGGAARFSGPHGLALTPDGTLYVADIENFAIRSARVAPVVSLSPSGAKLVLNWSVLLTGYVAQASASLSTGYTNLPGAVTVDETTYITNTPSGTRAFYRLYKP